MANRVVPPSEGPAERLFLLIIHDAGRGDGNMWEPGEAGFASA